MNKTTIIYIIVIIFIIYLLFNLKPYSEKFTQTAVPIPRIYLPLTIYRNNRYAVDVNKNPVILNEISKSEFDSDKGVLFNGSNNKYIMISELVGNYTICFNIYTTSIVPNTYIFNHGQLPAPDFNLYSIPVSPTVLQKDPRVLYRITDNGYTPTGQTTSHFRSNTEIILDSREPAFNNNGDPYPTDPIAALPLIGSPINGPFIQPGTTVIGVEYMSTMPSSRNIAGTIIRISQPLVNVKEDKGMHFIYTFPLNFQYRKGMGLSVQVKDENNLRLGALDTSSQSDTIIDGTVSLLNKWNFVCVTVSGSTQASLWINGTEFKKTGNKPWESGKFIIGGQSTNGKSFTGYPSPNNGSIKSLFNNASTLRVAFWSFS